MRYKTLFLDFYGTLVHEDDDIIADIVKKICSSSESNPEPCEIASFWLKTLRSLFHAHNDDSFKPQKELEILSIDATLEHFHSDADSLDIAKMLFNNWRKPKIFEETVIFLSQVNIPVCIVSNIDRDDILAALSYHGIAYDGLVTSEDARSYKPRSEMFIMAMEAMKAEACDVLHVGDSITADIAGARAVGIDSFWINRSSKTAPAGVTPTYSGSSLLDIINI